MPADVVRRPPQSASAPEPFSLMAVLVFASLAVLLLYKGYDRFVEPHAAAAKARRNKHSIELTHHSTDKGLPGNERRDVPGWSAFHRKLAQEVADGDAGEGFEFVFYGDSITERWRGTEMDKPRKDGAACVRSFRRSFGEYRTALLAISGDQTGHLLLRLMDGETPERHQPKAAILLIGTNDLGWARRHRADPADSAPDAVYRLKAIVELLQTRLPGMHVVLAAILPRRWAGRTDYSWPNAFTKGVDFVNQHMATAAASMANVTFVDCNGGFMARGKINSKLMPDALHPNPAGLDVLAKCHKGVLSDLGLLKQTRRLHVRLKQ